MYAGFNKMAQWLACKGVGGCFKGTLSRVSHGRSDMVSTLPCDLLVDYLKSSMCANKNVNIREDMATISSTALNGNGKYQN